MNKAVASVIITLMLLKQGYIGKMKLLKEIEPVGLRVHFLGLSDSIDSVIYRDSKLLSILGYFTK